MQASMEVTDLGRRAEVAAVVAIRPEAAFALQQLVERAGDADLDARHSARDAALVIRLDDEVKMVLLNREVNNLEVWRALRGELLALREESALHEAREHLSAQRWHALLHA